MKCYHHIDMDGKSAGWIVHTRKPNMILDNPEDYIMTDYNTVMDMHTDRDDVFIVDICISEGTYPMLLEVCKTARTVTWIDHHVTSVEVIKNHFEELQAIENLTYFVSTCACGAALTYAYFNLPRDYLMSIRQTGPNERYLIDAEYRDGGEIKVTMTKFDINDKTNFKQIDYVIGLPNWLYHVDDYDCWKKIEEEKTEAFILGTEAENTALTIYDRLNDKRYFNTFWSNLDSGSTTKVIEYIASGKHIKKYLTSRYNRELVKTFEWEFQGTTFLCKNCTGNSWNFGNRISKYPAVILFNYDGKTGLWVYSVYSVKKPNGYQFNCSEFCRQFDGGGGHPNAAGFSTKTLIFTDPELKNKDKENVIFLGGTCNNDQWRERFIHVWKTKPDEVTNKFKLFNPVVNNWTEECAKKEDEVKAKAKLNLFVLTNAMTGFYSIAEAVDCSYHSKVFLAVYNNRGEFTASQKKSFDAIGKIIERNGGTYKYYDDNMSSTGDKFGIIVSDVIETLNKL